MNGYVKLYEQSPGSKEFVMKKSHYLSNYAICSACQVKLVQSWQNNDASKPIYVPGDSIACANLANDIFIYSFEKGYILNQFYAHDDYITGMLFVGNKLVSYSLDQTIKVWLMKFPVISHKHNYEDMPVTIFDHEA